MKKNRKTVKISPKNLMDLVWMARRYADGRRTWAPEDFNRIYEAIKADYPEMMAEESDDKACPYWPYAQDGMFKEGTGNWDARPIKARNA